MSKAIRTLGLQHPTKCVHDFKGNRWQELQEIHALEQLSGGLTMKCQTENVATAGYWYHWLDTAFGVLAGRLPLAVVDMDNMTAETRLPTVLRNPDNFRPLPTLVRKRHQMEFKRRFGLSGDLTGMDVDMDWRPTMTPAFGLPILLDPRLNNVTTKFGLSAEKREEYETALHDLHYQWYLRARQAEVAALRIEHARNMAEAALHVVAAAKEQASDPFTPVSDDDMGWDNPQPADTPTPVPEPVPTAPAEVPLVSRADYLTVSKQQYAQYVAACRTGVQWRFLFPDAEYCVGHKGIFWQEKLANVNLAGVWNILKALNVQSKFGFFVELAQHSRANVYKLQASSFVERVNSAGKIVLNDTNIKLQEDKVEKRVMLRMNRRWMAHMKATYTNNDQNIMALLRASHEALQQLTPMDVLHRAPPLLMTIDDDPHWPPNVALDEDHAARLVGVS
jgi:hypothetical protein